MRRDRTMIGGAVATLQAAPASGQVGTSCMGSQLVTTFTPCLDFVTGSTNGGRSPTQQRCKSVAEMVRTGADCACLILTDNVPFCLPINRTLAVSLPRLCNSMYSNANPSSRTCCIYSGTAPLPPMPPEPSVQPESRNDPTAASPAVESPLITMVVPSLAWRSARVPLAPASVVLLVAASIWV